MSVSSISLHAMLILSIGLSKAYWSIYEAIALAPGKEPTNYPK